jgi:hypothetical protein
MLTWPKRRPRLVVPTLSAIFLLMLSGDPSPAQEPGPPAPQRAPGQVVEVVGSAATVVETAHYQAQLALTCGSFACFGDFPRPGARRRLNVTRMSCWLVASSGSTFAYGESRLVNADYSVVLSQFLPVDHSGSSTSLSYHTLNRAVDLQLGAKQHIHVSLILASGQSRQSTCTATGTLDRLQ